MVNCSLKTIFVESVNAFLVTRDKIYELLDKFVKKIGEENIVQVTHDTGSNYVFEILFVFISLCLTYGFLIFNILQANRTCSS